ncbi:MAG TPA: lysylphosphatidylglycerol synthase transmembrane domain-containing protein [Acidimicrobiales bacterium]|nr:lysylphosphatidylglycerol synthase transmembrane domain-containing protein [Acidimicrobiales bacterium]
MQSTRPLAPDGPATEQIGVVGGVLVSVSPRQRIRSQGDVVRLIVSLALIGVGVLMATWLRNTIGGAEEDLVDVYERVPDRFGEVLTGLAVLGAGVGPLVAVVVLVVRQRFRQAAMLLSGAVGATVAMQLLTEFLADQGIIAGIDPDTDRVVELTSTSFPTSPLIASAVALMIISVPWLSQQWRRVLWSGVGLLVLFRVVSSNESSLDVVIAIAVGMAMGSLALLVFGTESSDPEAPELVAMLRTIGRPRRIEQMPGNSPLVYAVEMAEGGPMEMRVRTVHDRSENRLEQLWRSVRLRTWVNDPPYDTVQRRIEHEALAQRASADAGARVAPVRGIVASPHGSVGLLEDRVDGGPVAVVAAHPAGRSPSGADAPEADGTVEALPTELDRAFVADVWRQVEALHRARIAHRNLDLHEIWVTPDGHAELRGFDGAAIAATDRDLALDRAQLLVSTALVMGAEAAVEVAASTIGTTMLTSAVPYLQPLALPSHTRRAWRNDRDVLDALRAAIAHSTGVEPSPLARLDRIRPRTAMSLTAFVVAFYVLLPQLGDFSDTVDAASEANWWWLAPMLLGSAATIVFAALSFVASVPEPIPFLPALRMQLASSFLSRIAPANTGTLAVGVRFLQRAGLDPGPAAAAVGLSTLAGFVVHLALMGAFLLWVGSSDVGFSLPQADVIFIVITVALSASGLVIGLVPAVRRRVLPPLLAQVRNAASSLADVLTDPVRVIGLIGGSTGVTSSFIVTLAAAVAAFGGGVSFPEVGAAYLVAAALGSAAPTPGGLGAVEAALVTALTGYGMSTGPAVSAVLTFRLVTYWLPMLPGWFTFQQMQRREEL